MSLDIKSVCLAVVG